MKTFITANRTVYAVLGVIFLFIVWWIASIMIDNSFVLPTIPLVASAVFSLLKESNTYVVLFSTLWRLLMAVMVSFGLALLLASLSSISNRIAHFVRPMIILFKTIPVASIIIILLIIVGHERSPMFITGLVILPILYEGMLGGMASIDKNILEEIKMVHRINFTIIYRVFIPMTLPAIITATIQSIGLGLKVIVMSEFITQPNNSIGKMILMEKQFLEMARVFAWTIIIIIIIMLIEYIIYRLKKRFVA